MTHFETPNSLLDARRNLTQIEGCKILADWKFYQYENDEKGVWAIHLEFILDLQDNEYVESKTKWFAVVQPEYPLGFLRIYPAQEGGIRVTFPHQEYNTPCKPTRPWRKGYLCTTTPEDAIKFPFGRGEPRTKEKRLFWSVSRAIEWTQRAASGTLLQDGEFFELPIFPKRQKLPFIVYSEDSFSFSFWKDQLGHSGSLKLQLHRNSGACFYSVRTFFIDRKPIHKATWGKGFSGSPETGLWILLSDVPMTLPWQAPMTYGELISACEALEFDFIGNLRNSFEKNANLRKPGSTTPLLVGFPIPLRVGEQPCQIHWQALQLPSFETGKGYSQRSGSSINSQMKAWQRNSLQDHIPICWMESNNWSEAELRIRGSFGNTLAELSVVMIGAGAIGAPMAEIFCRGGLKNITIIDEDTLIAGNLVRHTLCLDDIGQKKANAISNRLSRISPNVNAHGVPEALENPDANTDKILGNSELILDCTGAIEVLEHISALTLEKPMWLVSVSFGYEAERLFLYITKTSHFDIEDFKKQMEPLEAKEKISGKMLQVREGAGCWHPAFPARQDHVLAMVGVAVDAITSYIKNETDGSRMIVFERQSNSSIIRI